MDRGDFEENHEVRKSWTPIKSTSPTPPAVGSGGSSGDFVKARRSMGLRSPARAAEDAHHSLNKRRLPKKDHSDHIKYIEHEFYLRMPQTPNAGAAYFYLGAALLEQSILMTPQSQLTTGQAKQLSEQSLPNDVAENFRKARAANYKPLTQYVSPVLLKAWGGDWHITSELRRRGTAARHGNSRLARRG
jgi:hypothetical protein